MTNDKFDLLGKLKRALEHKKAELKKQKQLAKSGSVVAAG